MHLLIRKQAGRPLRRQKRDARSLCDPGPSLDLPGSRSSAPTLICDCAFSTSDRLLRAMPPKFSLGQSFVSNNRAASHTLSALDDRSSNRDARGKSLDHFFAESGRAVFRPESDRIVVQDMENRVILARRKREFQNPADEERKNGATAAAFRFQMGNIRQRHVVREVVRVIPIEPAIHGARTKTTCSISLLILVDYFRATEELFTRPVQIAIMI